MENNSVKNEMPEIYKPEGIIDLTNYTSFEGLR